ncbi:MAG: VanW family protein [Acutalibacteraceae bacterium]|nr:VanW family protein [Acutalibacteraceae bacterium]
MANENNKINTTTSPAEDKAAKSNASKSTTATTNTTAENTKRVISDEEAKKVMQDIDALIAEVRMQTELPKADISKNNAATHAQPANDNSEEEMVDITELSATTTSPKITVDTTPADKNTTKAQSNNTAKATNSPKPEKAEKKKSNHLFAKIFCAFLTSVLLSGAAFYYMYKCVPEIIPVAATVNVPGGVVKPPEEKAVFLKGIQVSGVEIGGKTLEEAKSLLALRGTTLLPEIGLTVNYNGQDLNYKNKDFEFTYDLNAAIEKAYKYNQEVLKSGFNDIMSKAPTDEGAIVDSTASTVNFKIDYKVTESSVKKIVKRVAKEVDNPCVEPHVSKFSTSQAKNSKRYTFKEGTEGTVIDQDELISAAMDAFNKGETDVILTGTGIADKPKLKMADVKKATKLIGKFSTYSTNTYNANLNMAQALKAINGTILEPGDTLSFNECTGDSNQTSNGYYYAGVIANGAMTTGVGGGICQTATTLYNAAIMANMEIVEREPHLWCSYYVYGGLDATIDWGNIDLKLKNNTDYQMFFKCWMDGTQLNVEIYGYQSPDFDEVRTETELDWYTSDSYGYNSYRVFYKNGKEVSREELPYSVYSLSNGGGIRGADPGDVSKKLKQPE